MTHRCHTQLNSCCKTPINSLAPSHLRIQKAGDPASQSSLQRAVREAIKIKADSYQREAAHRDALLVPFVMTAVGGFTPLPAAPTTMAVAF